MSGLRLAGKVAFITGGASGIGRACALRFAEEGADVFIADLFEDRARAVVEEVRASTNQRAACAQADVSRELDIQRCVDAALAEFGHIDTAVAAAGVASANYVSGAGNEVTIDSQASLLVNVPVEDWERVLRINLTGVMLTDRIVARQMISQGSGGTLVNIASTAAKIPLRGAGDYCVSKAGVAMLTQVLAMELVEHGIRVNAIGPGFIETPMTANLSATEEGRQMMEAMTPMGRLGRPEEMANTALFLASEESSYNTGQTFYPNGGMTTG